MENKPQQALTVHRIAPEEMVAVVDQLLQRRPGLSPESPNITGADVCNAGTDCYQVRADGHPVMHYAVERVTRANGKIDAYVLAADGKCKGVDLTRSILPHIERQLAGCDQVIILTTRRGLAAKLGTLGYSLGGVIMRKKLQ